MTRAKEQSWPKHDLERMHAMRQQTPPMQWKLVGDAIGRDWRLCATRYYAFLNAPAYNRMRREIRAERKETIKHGLRDTRTVNLGGGQSGPKLTPELFDRQARRLAAYDARDITGAAFGDPPRGYSALDERGGRAP